MAATASLMTASPMLVSLMTGLMPALMPALTPACSSIPSRQTLTTAVSRLTTAVSR
jgi:hypothetical protein